MPREPPPLSLGGAFAGCLYAPTRQDRVCDPTGGLVEVFLRFAEYFECAFRGLPKTSGFWLCNISTEEIAMSAYRQVAIGTSEHSTRAEAAQRLKH